MCVFVCVVFYHAVDLIVHVGGKGEITIHELAQLIISQTNSKSAITFTDYQDAYAVGYEDMARRVPDVSKIKEFIGWESIIDLKTIINDIANSYA